jgi:hypothetical protein
VQREQVEGLCSYDAAHVEGDITAVILSVDLDWLRNGVVSAGGLWKSVLLYCLRSEVNVYEPAGHDAEASSACFVQSIRAWDIEK